MESHCMSNELKQFRYWRGYFLIKWFHLRRMIQWRLQVSSVSQIAKIMGPIWGPAGPHVGPMNLAIRALLWGLPIFTRWNWGCLPWWHNVIYPFRSFFDICVWIIMRNSVLTTLKKSSKVSHCFQMQTSRNMSLFRHTCLPYTKKQVCCQISYRPKPKCSSSIMKFYDNVGFGLPNRMAWINNKLSYGNITSLKL